MSFSVGSLLTSVCRVASRSTNSLWVWPAGTQRAELDASSLSAKDIQNQALPSSRSMREPSPSFRAADILAGAIGVQAVPTFWRIGVPSARRPTSFPENATSWSTGGALGAAGVVAPPTGAVVAGTVPGAVAGGVAEPPVAAVTSAPIVTCSIRRTACAAGGLKAPNAGAGGDAPLALSWRPTNELPAASLKPTLVPAASDSDPSAATLNRGAGGGGCLAPLSCRETLAAWAA